MSPSPYASRREALARWLRDRGAAAAWIGAGANCTYLTGWRSPFAMERLAGLLLTAQGEAVLLVPELDRDVARAAGLPVETWRDSDDPFARLAALARAAGAAGGAWAVERSRLTLERAERLRQAAGLTELADVESFLADRRAVKDPSEVEALERAAAVLSPALDRIRAAIRPGVSERSLALAVREALAAAGADDVSFEPITLTGPNSALPHGWPGARAIAPGEVVLVDFGALVDGYCSDITRTFTVGRPSPEVAEVYAVVSAALRAGIAAVRPGALPGEVDAAARRVIDEAGYGAHFTHRVGHGIGLEAHEAPWLHDGYRRPLEPGMVVTVEPGIYLPGRFGVRIEEMVLVTEDGHRVLTRWPNGIEEMEVTAS